MHYRLRCSIGFWNEQKVDKSRCLFLSQKTPLSWRKWFFDPNMTQILYQKSFITFSENKYGQNHGQCSEKVEGGLSRGWFLVWWKYRPRRGKKLIITSFTEAAFMVVPFSLPSWLRSVHFVLYKYKMRGNSIWNIWMWIKWERNLSEIFGRG